MNVQVNPHFYNFLAEGNIISGTKAETAQEAISELARLLARNTAGLNAQEIIEEVMLREKRMPTVIGSGLAVPHARPDLVVLLFYSGFQFLNWISYIHPVYYFQFSLFSFLYHILLYVYISYFISCS